MGKQKSTLPEWGECRFRVENKSSLEQSGAMKNGVIVDDFYLDVPLPDPIHEFIYEYDDSDPEKSYWFMHRLELLIEFVRKAPTTEE